MLTPSQEIRRTALESPRKLTKGLDQAVEKVVGGYQRRPEVLRDLLAEAAQVDAVADGYAHLSDRHLRDRLDVFRELYRRGRPLQRRVEHHALAAVREAAERTVGLRPFVVQLAGALTLHRGYLAEMATGEGKTLTAGLAAVLAGWTAYPCHIITVNDYLAQRDAEWMRPLYRFCGVRVGYVQGQLEAEDRRKAYDKDVTYCTGKEIVADFLRDRLRLGLLQDGARRQIRLLLRPRLMDGAGLVMRGLGTAFVDEADSVMIDEAVTPVIISSPHENDIMKDACRIAAELAAGLQAGSDYRVSQRYKDVEITDAGERSIAAECARLPGIWKGPSRRVELIRQALTARQFFHLDKQYVIQEGKVVIVDEFTGRIMPQRTWREGLHQAIEAKEGIEITDPSETLARLSFQRFYRFFRKLAGMTGTAQEAAPEFWHMYRQPVVAVPTNRPCIRDEMSDRVFPDQAAKWDAVVEAIQEIHGQERPILVGTRSVAVSEMLAQRLEALGMEHQVLNAVRHREEARIVAEAGQPGRITIATNMAGRGTDIKLARGVAEVGGLHVLATERHESRRIDRQLSGRSGRQGDPGSAQAFVSVDDELIRRFVPRHLQRQLAAVVSRRLPGWKAYAGGMFARAQESAQRMAYRQRRNVLRTDTWMEDALAFAGEEV